MYMSLVLLIQSQCHCVLSVTESLVICECQHLPSTSTKHEVQRSLTVGAVGWAQTQAGHVSWAHPARRNGAQPWEYCSRSLRTQWSAAWASGVGDKGPMFYGSLLLLVERHS